MNTQFNKTKVKHMPEIESTIENLTSNIIAELGLLAAILREGNQIFAKFPGDITHSLFFSYENQIIFTALNDLNNQKLNIDYAAVLDKLKIFNIPEDVMNVKVLMSIVKAYYKPHEVESYIQQLKEKARIRQLSEINYMVDEAITKGQNSDDIMNTVNRVLIKIGSSSERGKLTKVGLSLPKAVEINHKEKTVKYLLHDNSTPTGFKTLDGMLGGGFRGAEVILIGARPAQGKTSFLTNLAINIANSQSHIKHSRNVALFSLEMTKPQVSSRIFAQVSKISKYMAQFKNEKNEPLYEFEDVAKAEDLINNLPLYVDDSTGLTVSDIRHKCLNLISEVGPLGMVGIDYIQLMKAIAASKGSNKTQELEDMIYGIKDLSKEFDCPFVPLSQLSRSVEDRANKRPQLSDLRSSGGLEQGADAVLFIYRDEYYTPTSDNRNTAEVIVAKQREGETGTVHLFFDKAITDFREKETGPGDSGRKGPFH